jgi:putative Holliday junction resolvase
MYYLGIDYGIKRIGLAISSGGTDRAIAKRTVANDDNALQKIIDVCDKKNIDHIVIGESKNFHGQDNEIMKNIRPFQNALEANGFTVTLVPEFLTTAQARRQPDSPRDVDGSAAALILQTFLDQKDNQPR